MQRRSDQGWALLGMPLLVMLVLLLAGCTVLKKEIDAPFEPSALTLEEGKTHYRTVLHKLGPPAKMSRVTSKLAFLYEYISADEKQLGVSLKGEVGRFFKLALAKGKADRQVLLLLFDEKGLLLAQGFREYNEELGSGASLQFIIAVEALVDSSHLEDQIGPHQWGAGLLKPLPETLNACQSLDTGREGLEQAGTPTGVGQHTLELRFKEKLKKKDRQ